MSSQQYPEKKNHFVKSINVRFLHPDTTIYIEKAI